MAAVPLPVQLETSARLETESIASAVFHHGMGTKCAGRRYSRLQGRHLHQRKTLRHHHQTLAHFAAAAVYLPIGAPRRLADSNCNLVCKTARLEPGCRRSLGALKRTMSASLMIVSRGSSKHVSLDVRSGSN